MSVLNRMRAAARASPEGLTVADLHRLIGKNAIAKSTVSNYCNLLCTRGEWRAAADPDNRRRRIYRAVANGRLLPGEDVVRTPCGREALVRRIADGRVHCTYLDDGDEVALLPKHLEFVRKLRA